MRKFNQAILFSGANYQSWASVGAEAAISGEQALTRAASCYSPKYLVRTSAAKQVTFAFG